MYYYETSYYAAAPNHHVENALNNLIIGFFSVPETTEVTKEIFEQHFRALAFTYGVEMQIVNHPKEIDIPPGRPVIAIEEWHEYTIDYRDFDYPEKAIYIVGNSNYRVPSDYVDAEACVHISVPHSDHPLYGSQALAIVLQNRYNKGL